MPTPSATLTTRNDLSQASALIDEFQYRQNNTLTKFESLCRKQSPSDRSWVVNILTTWGDDLAEGGISALYKQKTVDALSKCFTEFSFFVSKKNAQEKATDVAFSYWLLSAFDRNRVKQNISSGLVLQRNITERPLNPEFKNKSVSELGQILSKLQVSTHDSFSVLNVPNQLSHRPEPEKQEIELRIRSAVKKTKQSGLSVGINQMTCSLVPFFFKESRVLALQSSGMAFAAALYGRISWGQENTETINRVQSVLNLVKTFSFLFLTMPGWKQENMIRQMYPKKQKAELKRFFRMAKEDCHCCC